MSLFTHFIRHTRARLASAGLHSRLHSPGTDGPAQARVLQMLLGHFAKSDYGRAHRLEAGLSAGDFTKRAPVMTRETLEPILLRQSHGGCYLLSSEPCLSVLKRLEAPCEPPTGIPLTPSAARQFARSWKAALFAASLHRIPSTHCNRPALALGASANDLADLNRPATDLSALITRCAAALQPLSPLPFEAPRQKAPSKQGVLLAADPLWLATLFPEPLISTDVGSMLAERPAWTRELSVLVGYNQSTQGLVEQSRLLLGHPIRAHSIFGTELGIIATQADDAEEGMRVLTAHGLYYEFIPEADYHPEHPDHFAHKALPAAQLSAGSSYILLVSNLAGLCRFDSGERVRCVGANPLRIVPEGRQSRLLSIAGEKLTERALMDAMLLCCARHEWVIVYLHVAPLTPKEGAPPCHEWWLELKPGSRQTPTGPTLSEMIDEQLCRDNNAYAALRRAGSLAAPLVRLVIPGVFKEWLQTHDRFDPRFAMPRCLPNRSMADALAALAKFSD